VDQIFCKLHAFAWSPLETPSVVVENSFCKRGRYQGAQICYGKKLASIFVTIPLHQFPTLGVAMVIRWNAFQDCVVKLQKKHVHFQNIIIQLNNKYINLENQSN